MAGERILVVDDNPINLKLVHVLLSVEGYDVRAAASAEEVWPLLESFGPQLVLMDIQLPGTDGLEIVRQMKANASSCRIPVLAITAYAMHGDAERAREAGCHACIVKPINTRTLCQTIAEHLSRLPQEDARS